MKITTKAVLDALKKQDYPVFKGDWNITLVGVRSNDTAANTFNDRFFVLFTLDGKQHAYDFACTTDPGVYYREHPINVDGTAWLMPGHHAGCWEIGYHQGKYKALAQRGEMTVYRDNDGDATLDDKAETQKGLFGINCHHSNPNSLSVQVDKWSAGCQVLADPVDFALLMALVNKSAQTYGIKYSYTLLTEDQL
jgi:hypothetical protein|tara:strand:+ start:194 stop:775 length:582 start_codon:yes stop_codon:yes gene_type:complete